MQTDLLEHPAVKAWIKLQPDRVEPESIEILDRKKKRAWIMIWLCWNLLSRDAMPWKRGGARWKGSVTECPKLWYIATSISQTYHPPEFIEVVCSEVRNGKKHARDNKND